MAIIFSKMSGKNDPLYGKFEHPIKALIQSESNELEKKKSILDDLFNVEKSNRYAETVIGQTDFDTFMATKEGAGAENDSIELGFKKTIEHVAFMKEFTITKEMADDAKFGMGTNMKNIPRNFVRAYYKTRTKLGAWAYAHATESSGIFNKARVDLTCGDGKPLFYKAHPFASEKLKSKNQSNYYFKNGVCKDTAAFEDALNTLANIMRNFKDENGDTLGYVPDTIIIPYNRPKFEAIVKKVVGSERTSGTDYNDINIQYGNWKIIVLPQWETTDDRFILMSSEANKQLMGSMFYNRVPLDIQHQVDIHTRNYIWNGYCRFGLGFTTWKHVLLCVDGASCDGATELSA